jgi:hypothetical protein
MFSAITASPFLPVPVSGMAAHLAASGAPVLIAAAATFFIISLWIVSRGRV